MVAVLRPLPRRSMSKRASAVRRRKETRGHAAQKHEREGLRRVRSPDWWRLKSTLPAFPDASCSPYTVPLRAGPSAGGGKPFFLRRQKIKCPRVVAEGSVDGKVNQSQAQNDATVEDRVELIVPPALLCPTCLALSVQRQMNNNHGWKDASTGRLQPPMANRALSRRRPKAPST